MLVMWNVMKQVAKSVVARQLAVAVLGILLARLGSDD
jgi:hypothetical protein